MGQTSQDIFAILCDDTKWLTHHDYYRVIEERTSDDIKKACEENKMLASKVREAIENDKSLILKQVGETALEQAENTLLQGDVVGVDGTQTFYPMLSGGRAQVAVATVSYTNHRLSSTIYLSEHDFRTCSEDLLEALKQRRPSNMSLSQLAVRAIMRYKEIEIGLRRDESWLLFNGAYFPYELRSGAGSIKVVRRSTELLRRLTERGKVVAIIAKSKETDILTLGLGMHSGEYLKYSTLDKDLSSFLYGNAELGISPANLRGEERKSFEAFMNEVAPVVSMGIVKIGSRAYLFQAPTEYFDEAASIIIRDGMYQPMRGYPMLIDYADALLSRISSGGDFIRIIEYKLQKNGGLLPEMNERDLRRR